MLQNMHAWVKGWISWVLVGGLVLVFALWGLSGLMEGGVRQTVAVEVNDEPISQHELQITYERMAKQQQEIFAANNIEMPIDQKVLKEQALKMLIDEKLMVQAVTRGGYAVSKEQVDQQLLNFPDFQINGVFSRDRFEQVAASILLSPAELKQKFYQYILVNQLRTGVMESAFILKNEVEAAIKLIEQTRDVNYLLLTPEKYISSMNPTEDALQAYYEQHKENFRTNEQLSLAFIELRASDLEKQVTITDDDLSEYYQTHLAIYTKAGVAEPLSDVSADIKARLKAERTAELFSQTLDDLSTRVFEDPSSLQATADHFGLKVQQTGFFDKKGATSGISIPIENEAAARREAASNRSVQIVHEDCEQSKQRSCGLISDGYIYPRVLNAAFSDDVLHQRNNSEPIEIAPQQVVVIRLNDYKPSSIPAFDTVKNEVKVQVALQQATDKVQQVATDLLANIEKETSPLQAADQVGAKWVQQIGMTRQKINNQPELTKAIFALKAPENSDKPTIGNVELAEGSRAIVLLTGVHDGVVSGDQNKLLSYADTLLEAEAFTDLMLYAEGLHDRAKIVEEKE